MSTSTDDNDVVDIAANIGHVRQMMDNAIASSERQSDSVRLVAVSKTKPLELLQAAYEVRSSYDIFYTFVKLHTMIYFTHLSYLSLY